MSSKNEIGKTKRSTDSMIDDAIAQQNDWLENRRSYARRFLKTLNVFARPSPKKENKTVVKAKTVKPKKQISISLSNPPAIWIPPFLALHPNVSLLHHYPLHIL